MHTKGRSAARKSAFLGTWSGLELTTSKYDAPQNTTRTTTDIQQQQKRPIRTNAMKSSNNSKIFTQFLGIFSLSFIYLSWSGRVIPRSKKACVWGSRKNVEKNNNGNLPANIVTHIAEERENRYVANQDTIGSRPVTSKTTIEAIAHPRYTDDA